MRKTFAALGVVLLAAGAVFHQQRSTAAEGARKPGAAPPVPVVLASAEARDMPLWLELTGRTEAYETVTLKPRIEGTVQRLAFTEGQAVKAGEVLVRLDPADLQARLAQAEANAARSQAQLAKARTDLERALALKAKGFVSEEKVGDARTLLATAENSAKADAAAAELSRLQSSYTNIRAPFAGVIGAKLAFPGAAVKANETALAVINRVQPLYASFAVPEKYLPTIRAATSGGKGLAVTISVPGSTDRQAGTVRFIDNTVDASTGTIVLKAVLPNSANTLTAGQLVGVRLNLATLKEAVVIPAEAVQQGAEGSFVFAVVDGAAQVRKVKVHVTQERLAVIAEGLAAGEAVVVEGQLRLTPGAKVNAVVPGKAGAKKAAENPPASGAKP